MTLYDRIAAQSCAVVACPGHRVPDSLFCAEHLNAMWRNQLRREPDGTFTEARRFAPRDMTGWAA